jgi:drug/metabolite transporter (DMT)-like permease
VLETPEVPLPSRRTSGIVAALLAALTFGLTVPLAKAWFSGVGPWLLAGLLYLGSGIGLSAWAVLRGRPWSVPLRELPWLAGAVLAGGIVAPVLLLLGLRDIPASTASLMLTCEGLFTSLLAWIAFREHYDRRIVLGFLAIAGGAITLALAPGSPQSAPLLPVVLVLTACLAWGVDNNLTRVIALADPIQVAAAKGLVAGLTNTILAVTLGAQLPATAVSVLAGVVGFVGYGLSLALFVYALRELGTSRTSAYFSVAPFVGALVAVLILGEPFTGALMIAGALMGWGVWLHVTEHHLHDHDHHSLEHEHAHDHDEHHDHQHGDDVVPQGSHTHRHTHAPLRHRHAHFPDAHHRHDH